MKILAFDYKIKSVDKSAEKSTYMGTLEQNDLCISILSTLNKQQTEATVIHEIIEAINCQLELKLNHNKISCLETGLYSALKNAGVDLRPLVKDVKRRKK